MGMCMQVMQRELVSGFRENERQTPSDGDS